MCRRGKSWKHDYIRTAMGWSLDVRSPHNDSITPALSYMKTNTLARPIAASRVFDVLFNRLLRCVARPCFMSITLHTHRRVFTSVPLRISDLRPRYVNPTDLKHITKSFAMFSHPPLTQPNAQDKEKIIQKVCVHCTRHSSASSNLFSTFSSSYRFSVKERRTELCVCMSCEFKYEYVCVY